MVGEDKFLRIYSYQSAELNKKPCFINAVELQSQAKCLDFSPNGKFLAIGYDEGIFEVFTVNDNHGEFF